ncbi:NADH dehydrogenase [ubiquinone] 1 beta subcomplex subunit 3 [Harpegnathos saltator]|uniref:NADH dehydrogenase [ubiquinone] 1 beta subcomplex subunit 3 n=1 Tax=Harpegnathos saltator TaxID=610380 RepID=E2B8H0_HARSA|nr:NADH dehydrogenase [ubiquinone] 1 beta subcomplex subunit 3 [Harpegnathos saltator]XP_011154530.1 NADH dehydrogenase [ubiquinone] 1 beta subcomplex subunit 3 [Harpegnathos saltator]XP_011154531.1 NADH dehydrogenase [ubiquinone] 1 beta subcomplex subunit 3 [Harpegnathos saltator]XP_025159501.1 NADH dehydrogenase [ubiquinone] 1 beta subcomplex subunit 3 [Harpegnathos saltator]EFN88004.1 NADH dehydrogenase [ubiquinone] 1 beta subcomplex subunit 3 [Harpegnathos saltator]
MGGHEHAHEPPYKIPNPDIYKVEDVPELKHLQEELAKRGLKDPWLRNYVWRYQSTKKVLPRAVVTLTRGMKYGVPAFLITIAVEQYFGIDYSGHSHHKDNHGDNHH